MLNKLKEIYNLQNVLNIQTNGEAWATSGVTLEGRTINWYRCMYMEAAEAIDSLPWKHWKNINGEGDMENVKIELVDIAHFLMSQHIVDCGGNIDKCVDEALLAYTGGNSLNESLIGCLEGIISLSSNQLLPLTAFFSAVNAVPSFTMDDVYLLYIGKNCLNQFRQDNGYKDNTYIKIWDGREDNVWMQEVLNQSPSITYNQLYSKLGDIYLNVKNSNRHQV